MHCSRLPNEAYALYVLGLEEELERAHIRAHLGQNCLNCWDGIKEALAFWYVFANATAKSGLVAVPMPGPGLKRRILNTVHGRSLRKTMIPAWTWGRIAAGAVIAVGSGTSVWNLGRASLQPRVSEALKALQDEKRTNQELEADNLALRDDAQRSRTDAITQAPSARVDLPPRPVQDNRQIEAIQRRLAEAQAANAAAVQSFADGRLRVSELERDLRDKSSQLATASRNLEDAEQRYRAAVQQADLERQQRDRQETQFASAQARIRELENEVTQYRRVVETQQQKVAQNLQLIAMLQTPSASLVRLRGTEAGQMASGIALFTDRSRLVFFASNLPTPAAGRTYQLWLVRKRGPAIVSAGTFSRSGPEVPAVQFADSKLLTDVTGLAVTDEPLGGSVLPTGHKWLIGTPQG